MSNMGDIGNFVSVNGAVAGRAGVFAWLGNAGVVKLNLVLALSLISSYATGFDSSMMNGLQSLDTWKAYFGFPNASTLALSVNHHALGERGTHLQLSHPEETQMANNTSD